MNSFFVILIRLEVLHDGLCDEPWKEVDACFDSDGLEGIGEEWELVNQVLSSNKFCIDQRHKNSCLIVMHPTKCFLFVI